MIFFVSLFLLCFLLGSMTSFVLVVSPTVFKTLDEIHTQKFLRTVFPRLFLFGFYTAALAAFCAFFGKEYLVSTGAVFVAVGFLLNTYVITPKINRMRDLSVNGDDAANLTFKRLHLLSVFLFVFQFILSLLLILLALFTGGISL